MICIITDHELARSHGTGAQILQMFQGIPFHHFYWQVAHNQRSEVSQSTLLEDWIPNPRVVGVALRRFRRLLGISWWRGNQVNEARLNRYLRSKAWNLDVAYVVVARESGAARALSILRALKVPYVVNMVDVLHENGLDPETMPSMKGLLRGASGLMALLPSIGEEIGKFTPNPIEMVPVGKPLATEIATPPEKDEVIRMIIGGRPYLGGCRLLVRAWEQVKRECRKVELSYVGQHYGDIPNELHSECLNVGFLKNEDEYHSFLASAHLAFLTGPDSDGMHGKWSFPSRTVDHLMAGLPVLACVPNGSATANVLNPISPQAVAFTRSGDELVEGINRFTKDKETWAHASRCARNFVETNMSLEIVRDTVIQALETAKHPKAS